MLDRSPLPDEGPSGNSHNAHKCTLLLHSVQANLYPGREARLAISSPRKTAAPSIGIINLMTARGFSSGSKLPQRRAHWIKVPALSSLSSSTSVASEYHKLFSIKVTVFK